jgi:hypothetical protein
MQISRTLLASLLIAALLGCSTGQGPTISITPEQARDIAREAYVYGFPMVMNYKTMYNYVIDTDHAEYKGPFNEVSCEARLFTPDDKAIVTPNADTPYCMFWMDLRSEPLVLNVPELEADRFYHFQLIDLYTHNYAYVGTLTTGNGQGAFLLVGSNWSGEKPEGVTDMIRSETDLVFAVVRTQLLSPEDLPRVAEIQGGYELAPLSTFSGTQAAPTEPLPEFPEWVEGSQFDERFFGYLDLMMSLLGEPGAGEEQLWERLAQLGLGPGGTFDLATLQPDIREALAAGVEDGRAEIEAFIQEQSHDPLASTKIFGTREFLTASARAEYGHKNSHLIRAVAAHMGLYGNSGAEAIYPTYLIDGDQQPLDASTHSYTMTFDGGKLPPVKAFWSLTMYDAETQLFVANPLDKYLLNSTMTDQFQTGEDGSLTLYIQRDSPGGDREGNWLPAPDGPFYLVLRLYGPEDAALEGEWMPPPARGTSGG